MKTVRFGILATLLAVLLGACSQGAQPPQTADATTPAGPDASAGNGNSAYPAPGGAGYPGPTAVPTDGPLVIPQPASNEVGVISGVLLRIKEDGSREPISRGALYLGDLVPDASGVDTMVGVDKTIDPRALLNSRGEFVFTDVPAGRYGLMYDDLKALLLLHDPETSGDFIIEVTGGQSQSLGELAYPLPNTE